MLLLFILSTITVSSCNLLSAVVIHRHGDRNPYTSYKTDPYKDEVHWPEGYGQLTKRGLQRQYDLGVWLKNRYSTFLPARYSPTNIRAVSTDVDRTLMSAEVCLSGLYPPLDTDRFNPNINWQPIPVHTAPKEQDPILAMKKPCKKHTQLLQNLRNSQLITDFNQKYKFLYDYLTNKTEEPIRDLYDIENLFNALHTQFLADKVLPSWVWRIYPEQIKAAAVMKFKLSSYTKELARLKTGLLFGEILRHFENQKVKVLLYSGHDSTLANVLMTLGAFNDEIPPYSSAILLELYEKQTELYVNLFYRNTTGFYDLVLEGCAFNCPFRDFRRILEPIIVPDVKQWERECEN